MGKFETKLYVQQQQHQEQQSGGSARFCCGGCPVALGRRIGKEFNFRCFFVLILCLVLLVSGIFWIIPHHKKNSGFEAEDAVKKSAVVRAFFQLQMPVSQLVPRIGRLEYDIYEEIGLPDTKVAILSMHQPVASNWTHVVFGVLPNPLNDHITSVSLSLLKSSLIEVFLKQSNLTLTTSTFEQPSKFEILKYPGGLTVIPLQSASIWQMPQIMLNFTLDNSISELQNNFVEFIEQLKLGLRLRSDENVFVQLTNTNGSTVAPRVIVETSIMSDHGSIGPQRLKQLAQTITGSPAKNLGLDNTIFGEVKSISLSSYLKSTLTANPPAPSPQPSASPFPTLSPTYSPAPSSDIRDTPPPCGYHGSSVPPSSSPTSYPNPTVPPPSPQAATPNLPPTHLAPELAPIPVVSYGSSPGPNEGRGEGLVSPSPAPSSSIAALAVSPFNKEVWFIGFTGLAIFYNLCWSRLQ